MLIMKALWSCSRWTFFTTVFGLVQVWLLLGISSLSINKSYTLSEAVLNGDFVALTMALTAAVMLDYYIPKSITLPGWLDKLLFVVSPILVALVATIVFVALHTLEPNDINFEMAGSWELALFTFGIIYALVIKFILFLDYWRRQ